MINFSLGWSTEKRDLLVKSRVNLWRLEAKGRQLSTWDAAVCVRSLNDDDVRMPGKITEATPVQRKITEVVKGQTHWCSLSVETLPGWWFQLFNLKNISQSVWMIVPNIWKKTCSKPPTSCETFSETPIMGDIPCRWPYDTRPASDSDSAMNPQDELAEGMKKKYSHQNKCHVFEAIAPIQPSYYDPILSNSQLLLVSP